MSYYDGFVGNNELMNAALAQKECSEFRLVSLVQQTRQEIEMLEARLLRKKELLRLLDENPEINRIFDLMR